jgi:hypothetical protein
MIPAAALIIVPTLITAGIFSLVWVITRNRMNIHNSVVIINTKFTITNSDGAEIISFIDRLKRKFKSSTSQKEQHLIKTDRFKSETGRQTLSIFLPPFSGELTEDTKLKFSNGNFGQSIRYFYANKILSDIEQLKTTPPYPMPHVLTQFASMAYRDCKHRDSKPPEGWKLLTTACNSARKNGYYGAAYWHPEQKQVVIAHRGTAIKSIGGRC